MSNIITYYVPYIYRSGSKGHGYASVTVERDSPISTKEDIDELADKIMNMNHYTNVVPLNFIRLEDSIRPLE